MVVTIKTHKNLFSFLLKSTNNTEKCLKAILHILFIALLYCVLSGAVCFTKKMAEYCQKEKGIKSQNLSLNKEVTHSLFFQ